MDWVATQIALAFGSIADVCTNEGIRSPLNTASNLAAVAVLWRILTYVKRGSVTVGGTTVTIEQDQVEEIKKSIKGEDR